MPFFDNIIVSFTCLEETEDKCNYKPLLQKTRHLVSFLSEKNILRQEGSSVWMGRKVSLLLPSIIKNKLQLLVCDFDHRSWLTFMYCLFFRTTFSPHLPLLWAALLTKKSSKKNGWECECIGFFLTGITYGRQTKQQCSWVLHSIYIYIYKDNKTRYFATTLFGQFEDKSQQIARRFCQFVCLKRNLRLDLSWHAIVHFAPLTSSAWASQSDRVSYYNVKKLSFFYK